MAELGGRRSANCRQRVSGPPQTAGTFAQRGHGMIGTVLMAFAGEPLTILVLIAR
jgi:hypothetical protein